MARDGRRSSIIPLIMEEDEGAQASGGGSEAERVEPAPARRYIGPRCPLCEEPVSRDATVCKSCGGVIRRRVPAVVWLATGLVAIALPFALQSELPSLRAIVDDVSSLIGRRSEPSPPVAAPPAEPPSVVAEAPAATMSPEQIGELLTRVVRVEVENVGTGSGFLVSPDGLVLTSAHVVEGHGQIAIFSGGNELGEANVVESIEDGDLALLQMVRLSSRPMGSLELEGDGTGLRVGEEVFVLGYPLGLERASVTRGVVSAVPVTLPKLGPVIQVDASVNPGNSGGPVIDGRGRVVGVVAAKLFGAESMNYAVPINYATHLPIPEELKPVAGKLDTWIADAASGASMAWAEPVELRIVGAERTGNRLDTFVQLLDTEGKPMAASGAMTITVKWMVNDTPGVCVGSKNATPSMFAKGYAGGAGEGPAVEGPCAKIPLQCSALATLGRVSVQLEARMEGIDSVAELRTTVGEGR